MNTNRRRQISPRRVKTQSGNALLEGALSLTVFLMMFFGIIEFGRAVFAYNSLQFAAAAGARYGSIRRNSSGHLITASAMTTYVDGLLVGISPGSVTVTTTWSPDANPGSTITVNVAYAFTFLQPYMPTTNLNLSAQSGMTISQ